jgi:hypothetical protein
MAKRREKTQINIIRNENGEITTNTKEIQVQSSNPSTAKKKKKKKERKKERKKQRKEQNRTYSKKEFKWLKIT